MELKYHYDVTDVDISNVHDSCILPYKHDVRYRNKLYELLEMV